MFGLPGEALREGRTRGPQGQVPRLQPARGRARSDHARPRHPTPRRAAGPRRGRRPHPDADAGNDSQATQGVAPPDAGSDPDLTEFLAPPQADDELGRLGKYRILGSSATAAWASSSRPKTPSSDARSPSRRCCRPWPRSASAGQRFLREAQAMAAVEHDHIVRIYQVDEERGVPFLAMEFLKGETARRPPRARRQAAAARGAADRPGDRRGAGGGPRDGADPPRHQAGQRLAGVADGAGSRSSTSGWPAPPSQDAGLTQQGAIIGTPAYMAPEQARGEAVDARCDLFSLGCVLYRLLTGEQPFQGKDTVSTLLAVASHQPTPPAQLNAERAAGVVRPGDAAAGEGPRPAAGLGRRGGRGAASLLEARAAPPERSRDDTVAIAPEPRRRPPRRPAAAAPARWSRPRPARPAAAGLVAGDGRPPRRDRERAPSSSRWRTPRRRPASRTAS